MHTSSAFCALTVSSEPNKGHIYLSAAFFGLKLHLFVHFWAIICLSTPCVTSGTLHTHLSPREALRQGCEFSPHHVSFAAESLGSTRPSLLFKGHFQLLLSTIFHHQGIGSHQQNRWIQESASTGGCGSPQGLAHTLRQPGLDGSSSSGWEEISCQVWGSYITVSLRTNSSEEASWLKRMPNNCGVEK